MKKRNKFQSGLSLLLAVILIGMLVAVAAGLATLVIDSTRQSNDFRQSMVAFNQAESGLEIGLMVNAINENAGAGIGLNVQSPTGTVNPDLGFIPKYSIKGSLQTLEKLGGEYIIPFPWTGNAPWHQEGSKPDGGCDPTKPPLTYSNGAYFYYPPGQTVINYNVLNHPCNWNTIKVGEKVTIPLYYLSGTTPVNVQSFSLRVRTPCEDGAEFCAASERLRLNCFDKGVNEELCTGADTAIPSNLAKKGEIILSWQIDATDSSTGQLASTLPKVNLSVIGPVIKYETSLSPTSAIFEGKLNCLLDFSACPYYLADYLINENSLTVPVGSTNTPTILTILTNPVVKTPVLKLSAVSDLIGCQGNICPTPSGQTSPKIPYLEYQLYLQTGFTLPPGAALPGPANIITASGSSGAFTRTIEVSVPHESSTLEYVIQQ